MYDLLSGSLHDCLAPLAVSLGWVIWWFVCSTSLIKPDHSSVLFSHASSFCRWCHNMTNVLLLPLQCWWPLDQECHCQGCSLDGRNTVDVQSSARPATTKRKVRQGLSRLSDSSTAHDWTIAAGPLQVRSYSHYNNALTARKPGTPVLSAELLSCCANTHA